MSNYLAIATVTATLSQLVRLAISNPEDTVVGGADVRTARLTDTGAEGLPDTGVNVFLYQLLPNAAWRNADLPARRADGSIVRRPMAALDLHYLLTFHGKEGALEPQRLLGAVTRTLHAEPLLTRDRITSTLAGGPFDLLLAGSDLADAVEMVKFTPLALSLDELSKLWTMFPQATFALSLAYVASVVLIESQAQSHEALPVGARNVYVTPFDNPTIESAWHAGGRDVPLLRASTLRVRGRNLRGDVTVVRIGGVDMAAGGARLTSRQIDLTLDAPDLRAGVLPVQVVHRRLMGTPPVEHEGFESNVAPIVLRPRITNPARIDGPKVRVDVDITVRTGQRAVLLLNEARVDAPKAYSIAIGPLESDLNQLEFLAGDVAAGEYFVRLRVDGAESPVCEQTVQI